MRKPHLTAGFLSMVLAMSLPAAAQSSTTNSPEHQPPEAPSQSTPAQAAPSQSTPAQSTPSQAAPGQASQAVPQHARPQAQAGDDNPLNLTEEQKAKLRPILQDQNQQMEALRNDTSMTQEQKIAKANEVRQNASPKIRAILTPEQLQKLADLQQKARQQQQGAPAEPAPPPHR
jgi:Spy/CpxP family protein refolding chaperone